ncbi:O-antigen/teichoic acid export membrane protein [Mucilaginibacter gracilis]|uniref:O-antigen/teichoic acid export membrane protein n=1 Tax=Mucilaginibacter gracilis TaxID=423350 RepID=A0A495J698_9SPHI|nr:oligosaccharide flippase family protein [Mucilaginibacter gracilis]RKR83529.1 O-antigen/teichoic acid export membrane protein [Mucilaginibacter gracilis]
MKGKLLQNLSANSVQLIVNQLFGVVIFFVLSAHLDKQNFGQLNLVLAMLLAIFNVLSFGIDQVIVRKIAAGDDAESLLSSYLFHVIITGALFYAILFLLHYFDPQLLGGNALLLLIGAGKLMIFFSMPFKQLSAGFEQFKLLSVMSVISNIIRGGALLILGWLHQVNINSVIIVFIAGDFAELILSIVLFQCHSLISIKIKPDVKAYRVLLKQSFPQVGVVIFTSALARFDWIFIGLMVSAAKLADYSFAYKIFEMSTLPLLALAPLLVPRLTRLLKSGQLSISKMQLLLRMEMVVSILIALVLYLVWSPLVDWLTAGRYGAVNSVTILILAMCMPFLYINNYLWSISFAQGRLKMIFGIIMITFVVNLVGDVLLIPLYKSDGAALAYLLAMLVQLMMYLVKTDLKELRRSWRPLFICLLCAITSGIMARYLFQNVWLILLSAIMMYLIMLLPLKQIRLGDWQIIKHALS